jgi:hypothetical protein
MLKTRATPQALNNPLQAEKPTKQGKKNPQTEEENIQYKKTKPTANH